MSIPWFMYPICVPFGDPRFDVNLGGSHDLDVAAPPNYPVTALTSGTISDISSPSWGKQVCWKMDTPINGVEYMCNLHLSAVNPALKVGQHINKGDLVGWVGGAYDASMYEGTTNPTGQNFLNTISMSSRIQVGLALHRGPAYGGVGWENFPPVDWALDPTPVLQQAIDEWTKTNTMPQPVVNVNPNIQKQAEEVWGLTANMLKTCYGKEAPTGTGIYNLWMKAYTIPKFNFGPPVTLEQWFTNWNGKPGVVQYFASGCRCEWVDGNGIFYDYTNKTLFP